MPSHEIRKGFDLARRFHDAYTSHRSSHLCQFAGHCEDQIGLSDGKIVGTKYGRLSTRRRFSPAAPAHDPGKFVDLLPFQPVRAKCVDTVSTLNRRAQTCRAEPTRQTKSRSKRTSLSRAGGASSAQRAVSTLPSATSSKAAFATRIPGRVASQTTRKGETKWKQSQN